MKLPDINFVRNKKKLHIEITEKSKELFYIELHNKIIKLASYFIEKYAEKGYFDLGWDYNEFTYREQCSEPLYTGYDVEHVWEECTKEIQKEGYDATLATYWNGHAYCYDIKISW